MSTKAAECLLAQQCIARQSSREKGDMNVKQSQLQLGCVRTGLSLDLEGGMQVHTGSQLSEAVAVKRAPVCRHQQ